MGEFDSWIQGPSSDTHLTLGTECNGRLRAIEDVSVVDGGTTAWLQVSEVDDPQCGRCLLSAAHINDV